MTGIWHAMGKQPIIGGLCSVKLNGLKDSFTMLISLSLSPVLLDPYGLLLQLMCSKTI